jgi:hypothetical protein
MKYLRKIVLWLLGIVILIAVQGLILIYVYENEIKQSAVEKINKQLNTPIKVGKIELSYFEHFPFVSLKFPNVLIFDSKPGHKELLLSADEISMLFNVWDIYQGNYTVKKLYVLNGIWTSNIDTDGNSNFDILKTDSSDTKQANAFQLKVEEIILKNTSISHLDYQNIQEYTFSFDQLNAKGNFSESSFNLDIKSNAQAKSIKLNKVQFLRNKEVTLNTSLFVDLDKEIYQFNKTELSIEKLKLLLDGYIQYSNLRKYIDLKVSGKELDIQSFVSLLPSNYKNYFKDYTSTGNLYFNMQMQGSLMPDKAPNINVSAGFDKVSIVVNNENISNQKIDQIKLKFNYQNNRSTTLNDDVISVNEFYGVYQQNKIIGNVVISNLNDPFINLYINTKQSLVALQNIWPIKNIHFESGEIEVDLKLKAKLADLKKDNNLKKISSEGNIKLYNTKLRPGKYALDISQLNGNYNFQRADLRINAMSFKVGNSDFKITGYFRNLFSYLLVENEDLEIDATLFSNKIDLKELLGSSATSTEEEPYKLKVNKKLNAKFKFQIKELNFLPFQAFDMEGGMKIENQIISTDYLAFRSQKGLAFAKIDFNTQKNNHMPMTIDLNLNKVDASNLFREFNNFNLDIITDKNIRGQISTNLQINMIWDENLKSKLEDFYAKGKVLIENGQLLNFEPMLALGKYIDVNELNNLRFSNLENTIEIKNKIIAIPDMEIKSNALSLRLSGTHSFENQIDYHLQMLLSDFIKKKSKRLGDERFGEIEPDGSGNTKLYVRMYGDAANPKFSLDKQMIKKKIAEDFKNERQEVKQVLKDEFGSWFKKEKEFKESISEQSAEWEKDIPNAPNTKTQNKSVSSTDKTDSLSKKTKLQKLKEKLKEKPDPEDE